ncbi:MAG: STAS domain-containing protein [Roseiflexaceae bacterium]|nr:STAS domain-containing protein [Roseiflexaceae bacterium]
MITTLGSTFETGFLAWGRAVGTAGWGKFELPHFDDAQKQAVVVVRSPWELVMQRAAEHPWGCPFLQGKIIGVFSHAFGSPCWASEDISIEQGEPVVTFRIYPSTETIESEVKQLRDARKQATEQEIERKTAELLQANAERALLQEQVIQMQAAALAELSTPLIPLNDQVMIMPLIGAIDSQRAQQIVTVLLEGVADQQARFVIIDITGVSVVDTAVANVLIQAARAVGLLGAQAILTGIRPEIAQTLVGLGVDLDSIVTQSSMQSGVAYAMRRR